MADWIVIQKHPDLNDLAIDIISLGLFGLSEHEPNVYRIENTETGEQKVIKTMAVHELGDHVTGLV